MCSSDLAALPGFDIAIWWGLIAPAATPKALIARINADVATVLKDADLKERFAPFGIAPTATTPAEFDALIHRDVARFGKAVADAGVRID